MARLTPGVRPKSSALMMRRAIPPSFSHSVAAEGHDGGYVACVMCLGLHVEGGLQRGFAGGWACGDGVVAGKKLPAVLVGVEDGE